MCRAQGVQVGDWWRDRLHCRQWGAHFPHVAGIAGQSGRGAQSVVLSGGCGLLAYQLVFAQYLPKMQRRENKTLITMATACAVLPGYRCTAASECLDSASPTPYRTRSSGGACLSAPHCCKRWM